MDAKHGLSPKKKKKTPQNNNNNKKPFKQSNEPWKGNGPLMSSKKAESITPPLGKEPEWQT